MSQSLAKYMVRQLTNPHFSATLRPLTALSERRESLEKQRPTEVRMNPLALLKHAGLDAIDAWLRRWKTWQLWSAIAALAVVDVATAMFDLIPLVDDMLVGGLAIMVSAELLRRRKGAKEKAKAPVLRFRRCRGLGRECRSEVFRRVSLSRSHNGVRRRSTPSARV